MKRCSVFLVCFVLAASVGLAQSQLELEQQIKVAVPYHQMLSDNPGLTLGQYNAAVREVARSYLAQPGSSVPGSSSTSTQVGAGHALPGSPYDSAYTLPEVNKGYAAPDYLGRLSNNPYQPDSTSNPYGAYGSPYSPQSLTNPYGKYGSPYSPNGATNPYATSTPRLYGQDGQYLGKVSTNPYDPESISNPYGAYGSRYSPTSVNNPYSPYGSPYSPTSATNPYAITPPVVVSEDE